MLYDDLGSNRRRLFLSRVKFHKRQACVVVVVGGGSGGVDVDVGQLKSSWLTAGRAHVSRKKIVHCSPHTWKRTHGDLL